MVCVRINGKAAAPERGITMDNTIYTEYDEIKRLEKEGMIPKLVLKVLNNKIVNAIADILNDKDVDKLVSAQTRDKNLLRCAEEAGEWVQTLSKMARITDWETQYTKRRSKVVEETADLVICISMVCFMYDIVPMELMEVLSAKMERNLERIGGYPVNEEHRTCDISVNGKNE